LNQITALIVLIHVPPIHPISFTAAYEMHLSPLLYLEEVIKLLDSDAVVGLKEASGYIQNTPRLEVLKSAAEDVKKYASLSREVDMLQKKVIELGKYVPAFTKAHFKDQRTMKNIFKDLLNPDRVYPGIKEVEKKEAKKVSP
jgi:hypothetical protein